MAGWHIVVWPALACILMNSMVYFGSARLGYAGDAQRRQPVGAIGATRNGAT